MRTITDFPRNESGLVDKFIGTAYDTVKFVADNMEQITFIFDFMSKYNVLICLDDTTALPALDTRVAKFARVYDTDAVIKRYDDYIYMPNDTSGILPVSGTGSWVLVAGSGGGSGAGESVPWLYNDGQANGGEETIHIDFPTAGVPEIYINGVRQTLGLGYTFNILTNSIALAETLTQGDELVAKLWGLPALPGIPTIDDYKYANWLYNNGAAIGGEVTLNPPYVFAHVPAVFKNGLRLVEGIGYTADAVNFTITMAVPLVTGDTVVAQLGGELDTSDIVDSTLQQVARAVNLPDQAIILSSNRTEGLFAKQVIYDVVAQRAWSLPSGIPAGAKIEGVINSQLVYSPGSVPVTLLPIFKLSTEVTTQQALTGAVVRTQRDRNMDTINVKDFGAKGDGVTDDTAAIQLAASTLNAAILANGTKRTLDIPDGDYLISASLTCYENMAVNCTSRVSFRSVGNSKSFPAWIIYGGGRDIKLGSLSYFSTAFVNLRNTNRITFNAISFCTDGFILRADGVSNLDNEIRGIQVANCDNAGIVFEQNADSLIQQGNDIRVNFVSETPNMVQFRNFGGFTHTKQSNWDSNNIEVQAFDPLSLANSSMVRNSTAYPVPNLKLTVKTWLGGWVPDAGTICLIRGPFSAATYEVSIAGRIGLNELVDATGKASFGSCVFKNTRQANLGSATAFYTGVNPGTVFNSGESLVLRKFRIRVTVPDLAAGAVFSSSFNHVLSQVTETGRARMVQTPSAARGRYRIEFADAGAESQGMVRIWISNYTATTQTGRDVDIVFEME